MDQQYICLELTPDCNNSCRHCYNFWRKPGTGGQDLKEKSLPRDEIKRLIKKVKADIPLKYVALSGGEPLLRTDLPQIIADIIDDGLQPVVITNGVLLNDSLLRKLPGGVNFEITLLGHTAELHDRLAGNKAFDQVIHHAARLNKYNSVFIAVFVATRMNLLDVQRTAELAIALGARAIMYNRFNLSASAKPYLEQLLPTADLLQESLGLLHEVVKKYGVQAVCSVPIPPCVVDIAQYPLINFGWCPRGGSNAYYTIGHTGFLRPCNHSSLVLGDLRSEGFAEIISRPKSKSFWEITPTECNECSHPLKDKCRGGCTASAAEFYGSQNRRDPICEINTKQDTGLQRE